MENKIVIIIAFKDFRDEEYFVPKRVFEESGFTVKTASNKKGLAFGADGGEATVDLSISEVNPSHYDAVIFVGGPGCLGNLDNQESYRLSRQTVFYGKILGAICISPLILAKAGVLKGKKATVFSSTFDKSPIRLLGDAGAVYSPEDVVVDGKIITASGPAFAQRFAEEIVEMLTNRHKG